MGQEKPKKQARKPKPRPKKYLCPEVSCDKAYSRPCLLEQHLRSHADERPFACTHPGCGKAFLRDSHLKTHLLSHSVEKPLYCSYCGKGFNTNQHLNRHERTHVPSIKCTFEGCTAAFRRNSQLRRHISECHTLRKPFACPSCPREFDVKSRLNTHFAKCHSGNSFASTPTASHMSTPVPGGSAGHHPYHCGTEGCNEKFESWPDLLSHIKYSHKRHICTFCGKMFDRQDAMDMHAKEHDLESSHLLTQEWHCREPQCEAQPMVATFREKDTLISHYQQYHGFVPETLQVQVQTPASASAESLPPLSAMTEKQQFLQTIPQQPLPHLAYPSYAPQQQLPTVREPLYKGPSMIDRITGAGYDANRRIECPVDGCGYRFAREYDMKRHAKAVHPQVLLDDANKPEAMPTTQEPAQFNPAMPKFKFYMPPASGNSEIYSAVTSHPASASASPVPYAKHEDMAVSPALAQQEQQQLPPLSQFQHPPVHPQQQPHMLPSFENNMTGFDYLPHDLSLGGFPGVQMPTELLSESSGAAGAVNGVPHQYQPQAQGHVQAQHFQPVQPPQRGEFEPIDPMIVNN